MESNTSPRKYNCRKDKHGRAIAKHRITYTGNVFTTYCNVFGKQAKHRNLKLPIERLMFYAGRVGPKLKALLEKAAETRKGFDVTEELEMMRVAASQSVQMFGGLLELDPAKAGGEMAKQQLLIETGSVVMNQMDQVITAFKKASDMSKNEMVLTPASVNDVVKQIMRFVQITFADTPEKVDMLDDFLTNELELPSLKRAGTTITPDMVAVAMDATVPYVPDDDEDSEE